MRFRSVFIAVCVGGALIVSALIVNAKRPEGDTSHPTAELTRATGKCAECHRQETSSIVHQYERSRHAAEEVSCLQCHQPAPGQESAEHHSFTIAKELTSLNCKQCHTTEYDQFLRSRHGLPAWGAINGTEGASEEQVAKAESYHPGTVKRPPNALALLEGAGAKVKGCRACHDIGKPNSDGSVGSCTQCHSRHNTSVALARRPETCGQCHMGPDHSQLEIYNESKHGVLFRSQGGNRRAPKALTTADMPVPTCATCHLSGLEGLSVTHDTTERLSWWLFAPVSKKRPGYQRGQDSMQEVCTKCHARDRVESFYKDAEIVVETTNGKIREMKELMAGLRRDGLLTPAPFDETIEFIDFDIWHYYGRTAKHGAFMGGADFVQWHGNYELLKLKVEMEEEAARLRSGNGGR